MKSKKTKTKKKQKKTGGWNKCLFQGEDKLPLEIQLSSRKGWYLINRLYPAIFVCLLQAST